MLQTEHFKYILAAIVSNFNKRLATIVLCWSHCVESNVTQHRKGSSESVAQILYD